MTPKEKANDLVYKYKPYASSKFIIDDYVNKPMQLINSKKCASIAVDEILRFILESESINIYWIEYWNKVKQEIEKM